ncbi:hypothetical protein KSB_61030 [Ktedonobacter robiniae]|uniref:Uncharacterized protein n=1 Tax=Ktedonobacter robiniae TaxID=2778365 RepID=A0ABQ3UXX7_9CHLR|nr:hypothetical protein KSB_61030 [Ktedonobacter robiniae]
MYKIVGFVEGRADLTEGSKILLFDFIQRSGITHKQPDSRVGREFLETMKRYLCLDL